MSDDAYDKTEKVVNELQWQVKKEGIDFLRDLEIDLLAPRADPPVLGLDVFVLYNSLLKYQVQCISHTSCQWKKANLTREYLNRV